MFRDDEAEPMLEVKNASPLFTPPEACTSMNLFLIPFYGSFSIIRFSDFNLLSFSPSCLSSKTIN